MLIVPYLRATGQDVPDRAPNRKGWVQLRCVLPTHNDRKKSAAVHPQQDRFMCFRCGINVDAVGLVELSEGLSRPAASKRLELVTGLSVPQEGNQEDEGPLLSDPVRGQLSVFEVEPRKRERK